MSSEVHQILVAVRALSPEDKQSLADALERELPSSLPKRDRDCSLVEPIRGKYAAVPTSSEEFIARKRADVAVGR